MLTDDLRSTGFEVVPSCPICARQGEADDRWARLLALPEPYGALRCRTCGLRWLSPRPDAAGLAVIYSAEHYFGDGATGYAQYAAQRREMFSERARQMHAGGARSVLDYGAATGEFVALAREAGLAAEGVEFSAEARRQAADRGIHLRAPGDPLGQFDVIHMNHVLEHVPDPVAHLEWCQRHLTGNGYLWVEVPYQFDNDLDRLRRWTGKWRPRFDAFSLHHTLFFSQRSLRALCEKTGFTVDALSQPFAAEPGALSPMRKLIGRLARLRGNGDVLVLKASRRL